MTGTRQALKLDGCTVRPMASYLKSLGLFRLVADLADPAATAWWAGDQVVIESVLDEDDLVELLEQRYAPTPLVSPWNGRGGFNLDRSRDSEKVVDYLEKSTDERLAPYRAAIAVSRRVVRQAHEKEQLVLALRNELPDAALPWLDASIVLTGDGASYPPLLGSGGNLGSMDLSNNFMQHALRVLGLDAKPAPAATRRAWLEAAVFGRGHAETNASAGQFDPGAAQRGRFNPWGYVLMLEGALLFVGGASKRLGAKDVTSVAPFTFVASRVGYGSAATGENVKAEVWLPVWTRPCTRSELAHLLKEGRVAVGGRRARSGLDAIRAASTLGVDRGIERFERVVLAERFGQSILAVPVETVRVHDRGEVRVIATVDGWLERVRRAPDPPAGVRVALSRTDRAIHDLAKRGGAARLLAVLARLADLDRAVGRSRKFRANPTNPIPPLAGVSAEAWTTHLTDADPELAGVVAVATAFASLREPDGRGLRHLLHPVEVRGARLDWSEHVRVEGFRDRPLHDVLALAHAYLADTAAADLRTAARVAEEVASDAVGRRPGYTYGGRASLADVAAFVAGDLDEDLLDEALAGLLLLDWRGWSPPRGDNGASAPLDPAYQLLAPFWHPTPIKVGRELHPSLRLVPGRGWPRQLLGGRVSPVVDSARRRLRAARLVPLVRSIPEWGPDHARRLSAALLLQLSDTDAQRLLARTATHELPS
jgi:CRISPR-associated protein Csx17